MPKISPYSPRGKAKREQVKNVVNKVKKLFKK